MTMSEEYPPIPSDNASTVNDAFTEGSRAEKQSGSATPTKEEQIVVTWEENDPENPQVSVLFGFFVLKD